MQKHQHATKISLWYSCWFYPLMPHYLLTILTTSPFLVGKRTRRVGNWTHVLSVFGVHILDIGCETHGFGKQFSSWYSPCHCVLAFFVRFAMFSAFMSFQNQRLFSAVFLKYAGFSTFLRAFFFYRQGQSSRLDSLIQDFGSLLKQAGSSVFPSPLPGPAMLDQSRVISVSFLRS